jgi:hypothetical protein
MKAEYLYPIKTILMKKGVLEVIVSRLLFATESFKRNTSLNKQKGKTILCGT